MLYSCTCVQSTHIVSCLRILSHAAARQREREEGLGALSRSNCTHNSVFTNLTWTQMSMLHLQQAANLPTFGRIQPSNGRAGLMNPLTQVFEGKLLNSQRQANVSVLADSGATHSFCSEQFACQNSLRIQASPSYSVKLADGMATLDVVGYSSTHL
eukprot:1112870-Pelagomonas_calceolata.AAC.3